MDRCQKQSIAHLHSSRHKSLNNETSPGESAKAGLGFTVVGAFGGKDMALMSSKPLSAAVFTGSAADHSDKSTHSFITCIRPFSLASLDLIFHLQMFPSSMGRQPINLLFQYRIQATNSAFPLCRGAQLRDYIREFSRFSQSQHSEAVATKFSLRLR